MLIFGMNLPEAILGLLIVHSKNYEERKQEYILIGQTELNKIKNKNNATITSYEIQQLLNLMPIFKKNKMDLLAVIQEKYKKKLLEHLKKSEYEEIIAISKELEEIE